MENPLESEIQATICDYLTVRQNFGNLFFWRQNNQPAVARKKGGELQFRKMGKYTIKGIPDIIVVKKGTVIFLEVKRKGEKQSPDQVEFQKKVEAQGVKYYVVFSVDDVIRLGV